MSAMINKRYRYSLLSRLILLGAVGLLTSGCPLMMMPMMAGMGGMNDTQHQEQKKNTSEDATASKSRNASQH
ncbi:MAG: hypothetical protein H7839_16445 [Magnetococcus sp. YQC-5]